MTIHSTDSLRTAIRAFYSADETTCVESLLKEAQLTGEASQRVQARASRLVTAVRAKRGEQGLDAFLREYDLSSEEGVILMCLAEALLRIPDAETADRLIRDKLSQGQWDAHLGHSHSLLVNAATWGLMLTGHVVKFETVTPQRISAVLERLAARSGAPLIRLALKQAMHILAQQFVMGSTITQALQRSQSEGNRGYRYSFDMLGEAALCAGDAERYFAAYSQAITTLADSDRGGDVFNAPSVSVKLSALHPRYEAAQRERVLNELAPRVLALARQAKSAGIALTLDAEEAERLELSLDIFETVFRDSSLKGWEGFGLAVQAYQKRAPSMLDWLAVVARREGRRIPLRLVKGAYWDSEIKRAQVQGLAGYPVYTRKAATDVSYLACARRLFAAQDVFYPQFATHNAHTVAYILELAGQSRDFEFQRLHGMGEALYGALPGTGEAGVACRVYAPVGSETDLLPYLVRRLLENGANTSFVNRIVDERLPVEQVIADPAAELSALADKPNPRLPLPVDLYGAERRNAHGINLADSVEVEALYQALHAPLARRWSATPIVGGKELSGPLQCVHDPSDGRREVGTVALADTAMLAQALQLASAAALDWDRTPAAIRAQILERAADLFERRYAEFIALCVREAGKTIPDALAEVREAVDYCRYYAMFARRDFGVVSTLPGPTGESNRLSLHGRGVFACISPWNFPLAIFVGQITAALAAGNVVIAKPAAQTPLIAAHAVRLLHEAGVPGEVLHLLPGRGSVVGARLVADPRVAGVAFTGSTETARAINQVLAARPGPIVPFIAETGGQNAMIADSSTLIEQVVSDAIRSAFNSAGQRCSALRVLFVQEEIASRAIDALACAMGELRIGDPAQLATDIGPVIDATAKANLETHAQHMSAQAKIIRELVLPAGTEHGTFFAPRLLEIDSIACLEREVFGPCLHIVRYSSSKLDQVIEAINNTGYGLTLGIHSRIEETIRHIRHRARAGNIYVNRNMIGAVVGVQPFGGEGLSGTGPKAGGPHTLPRFAVERVASTNTAAVGGNAALLASENPDRLQEN